MPVIIFRRPGSKIWSYRGSAAGRRLRGSTKTTDKARAERIASKREAEAWKCDLDGPKAVLTFAKAALLYKAAGKETRFLPKVAAYWKDTLVKDMTAGAIRQCAIDLYPNGGGATRNRLVITPIQAVINHCAELEMCPPIRVRRFKFEKKIKKPVTLEWIDALCAHARPVIKALALDMFATGRRINEARRAEWSDYDFQTRTILIRDTKTGKERLAHMPNRLLVALANLPRDTKPFDRSESRLRRHWDEDIEATAKAIPGFERLTFHSCRHGFATTLLQGGVDVVTVSKLGGWSSPQQVLSTYAHAIEDSRITDRLFDTPVTQPAAVFKKINSLGE